MLCNNNYRQKQYHFISEYYRFVFTALNITRIIIQFVSTVWSLDLMGNG